MALLTGAFMLQKVLLLLSFWHNVLQEVFTMQANTEIMEGSNLATGSQLSKANDVMITQLVMSWRTFGGCVAPISIKPHNTVDSMLKGIFMQNLEL